VIESTIHLLMN